MKKTINLLFLLFFLLFTPLVVNAEEKITLHFFHGDGCPHCAEEEEFLDKIADEYPYLEIKRYEVWYNKDNSELLKKVEAFLEIKKSGVPTNVIGETVISGYSEALKNKIIRAIEYYHENDYFDAVSEIKNGTYSKTKEEKEKEKEKSFEKEEEQREENVTINVPLIGKMNLKNFSLTAAAALIGLVDGFNPCAMWVLLFLISVLIGMKDRKRMWILGTVFLLTSGLFYMLIMLSWITVVVQFTTIIWIRNLIAIVAIIGAIINLTRFVKQKDDSGCDVIDEKKRKKIFSKIKKFTSEKSLVIAIAGIMALAISVNVVELACSAGLPIVFSELLAMNNATSMSKFLYTLIYILFFMIDDFVVFFIAMFTTKVTGISTKYNKYSHLLGGIIMLLIGILLLTKPEWLMFNFK